MKKTKPAIHLVIDEFTQEAYYPFSSSFGIQIQKLEDYTTQPAPTIFALGQENLSIGQKLHAQLPQAFKAKSLITARLNFGEEMPMNQPKHTIIIPYCDDKKFITWLHFLAGKSVNHIYLDWFVAIKIVPPYTYSQQLLINAYDNLTILQADTIKRSYLENAVFCSSFKLDYLSRQIYGKTPGRLLRIWRYFVQTARFMDEEEQLTMQQRRGKSPLRTIAGDYCEALIRLLGISYTQLRKDATQQHWIVIWFAAFRKNFNASYKRK